MTAKREKPTPRRAGRAVVVGPDRRLLMLRGIDPSRPGRGGFWFTPGGGVEGAETVEEATRRELQEEVGLEVDELGPVVMERVAVFRVQDVVYEQRESIFVVHAPVGFEPRTRRFDELETAAITDVRWLGPAELRHLPEPHYPERLLELVDHVERHGPPVPPWHEISGGR